MGGFGEWVWMCVGVCLRVNAVETFVKCISWTFSPNCYGFLSEAIMNQNVKGAFLSRYVGLSLSLCLSVCLCLSVSLSFCLPVCLSLFLPLYCL